MAHRPRYSTGLPGDAAIRAADRVLAKEGEYLEASKHVKAYSLMLAERLAASGDVEKALAENKMDASSDHFIEQQRARLKSLSESTIENTRSVEAFLEAIHEVKDDLRARAEHHNGAASDDDNAEKVELYNFEHSIQHKTEKKLRDKVSRDLDIQDDPHCREMRARLGEKDRGSGDDELEVVGGTQTDSNSLLKCPILGNYYENPIRSKVCGHVFSRAGLEQLLGRKNNINCPVFGCNNNHLNLQQCEEDIEKARKVERHKIRMKRKRQNRMSQMDEDIEETDL